MEDQVERLKQLSQKIRSLSDYQASLDARDITERNLQVAIEACMDIEKIHLWRPKKEEKAYLYPSLYYR